MTAQPGVGNGSDGEHMDDQIEKSLFDDRPSMPDEPDESWWASLLKDEPQSEEHNEEPGLSDLSETHPEEVQKADPSIDWDMVVSLYEKDEIITLEVVNFNQGGVLVENADVHGFVPVSHLIDLPNNLCNEDREYYLTSYLDRKISLKVIECEPDKERIVFSERAAKSKAGQRKALLQSLNEGETVEGIVTNITPFGAFVDLGGLEGLIHISELSWGRVQHPSMILKVGDQVKTMVLDILADQGRIALSLKRLKNNPWDTLSSRLSTGDTVNAEISCIVKYGAFAKLEEGIEGLIHVSSINFPDDCQHIDEFLFEGLPVKVGIISIEPKKRRLGLRLESY